MIDPEEVIDALEEAGIEIPECKGCHERILFFKTKAGKWQLLNMDLTPHWKTCPERDTFRKKKT